MARHPRQSFIFVNELMLQNHRDMQRNHANHHKRGEAMHGVSRNRVVLRR